MNRCIDLHMHTLASDGKLSLDEIITILKPLIGIIASITNHDVVTQDQVYRLSDGGVLVPGTEISTYTGGMHLHSLVYAGKFPQSFIDLTDTIRDGKNQKVKLQCQALKELGFSMYLEDSEVDFTVENLGKLFPQTAPGNLTNYHIAVALYDNLSNQSRLTRLIKDHPGFNPDTNYTVETIIKTCLRYRGIFAQILSQQVSVACYEPDITKVRKALGDTPAIVSLAHPNLNFQSSVELHSFLARFGVHYDAIELPSTVNSRWSLSLLCAINNFHKIATFGSDFHRGADATHGNIGDMTQHHQTKTGPLKDILLQRLRDIGISL